MEETKIEEIENLLTEKTEAELKQEFLNEHLKLVKKYGFDFGWDMPQPHIIKIAEPQK
jgi:hypothetical protein